MPLTSYAIALGSNRRSRHGSPAATLRAAVAALAEEVDLGRVSTIRQTAAVGPAGRGFANAAALIRTDLEPPALLEALKRIERAFGRRRGRRWGPRVLDLDVLLWSEGSWEEAGLLVPHPAFRSRAVVLEPLAEIAPAWRDPLTGRTIRQLLHRLRRRRAVDPARADS
jgi:2-amino-4-hydroxy-6-hydroxymethyldihydropteridine diphosphokinase